jgi:hypothetical protein
VLALVLVLNADIFFYVSFITLAHVALEYIVLSCGLLYSVAPTILRVKPQFLFFCAGV